jgi:2-keto-4-pentenoate hydratase/2-oxohepta-3-ene-1,7-dioic acid hydratase in catechol pathway
MSGEARREENPVHLMRIGAPRAEKPVVRVDDSSYVPYLGDVADLTPPVWLQPGDVMELGIDGLGTQRQHVAGPE